MLLKNGPFARLTFEILNFIYRLLTIQRRLFQEIEFTWKVWINSYKLFHKLVNYRTLYYILLNLSIFGSFMKHTLCSISLKPFWKQTNKIIEKYNKSWWIFLSANDLENFLSLICLIFTFIRAEIFKNLLLADFFTDSYNIFSVWSKGTWNG